MTKEEVIKTIKDFISNPHIKYKFKEAIETVLNIIKNDEERIEYLQRSCERKEQSLIEERQENTELVEEIEKKDKMIDLMTESIELQQYANIDTTNLDSICSEFKCSKKCNLVKEECIKQYFAGLAEKERI